ncbi:MAG: YlmH/Sll1252 family protein [Oscillospiraceae bacterium]
MPGANSEERLFARRIADGIALCRKNNRPWFTFFLNEAQAEAVKATLAHEKFDHFLLWGGFENAARRMLGLFPDEPDTESFPLDAVSFAFRRQDTVTHRDVLGALMHLNIARETIGEILPEDGLGVVFLARSVAPLVVETFTRIGRTGVSVKAGYDRLPAREENFELTEAFVASLRFDCVLSAALRVSREKSAQLIRRELAVLRFQTCTEPDAQVESGDSFSVRGYGKFILVVDGGISKKSRLHVTIKKYI